MAKVLLVDSSDRGRESLRYFLSTFGHEVIEAATREVALKLVRASPKPLVLVLNMPFTTPEAATLLEAIDADERLRSRHAYVLLTSFPGLVSPALWNLLTRVKAHVLQQPAHIRVLSYVITLASHSTTADSARPAKQKGI